MRTTYFLLSIVAAFLLGNTAYAQNSKHTRQCVHCNMVIKDQLHQAQATITNQQTVHFDAIECLLNYLKAKQKTSFSKIMVSDYASGTLTTAATATYLISEAIKSPMGANLSAFNNKTTAAQTRDEKGGKLFSWQEIQAEFMSGKIGAHHHNHHRPDAHAPIGVMGDHLHAKGGFMMSLRYMRMNMEGNLSGTNSITDAAIYSSYRVAPQNMTMDMYMLGVMYAPTDQLTLVLMQNFVRNQMDLTAKMTMGGMTMLRNFSTSSSGLGDMKLGALYSLYNAENASLHLNGVLNLPVGNITQKDDTPMMKNAKLPYAMQLGSGTYDITLGATYKGNTANISWGVQPLLTFRTGTNSQGYRFGNTQQINLWGAYRMADWISVSGRVLGVAQGKISGKDAQLNPMMVTTADTNNYGGKKIKSFLGCNIMFGEQTMLKAFRLGIEAGIPIYEDYNGIQMNEGLSVQLGLKYAM